MPDIGNPHDKFFKEIFGQPEIAADFLASYLPAALAEALDLTTLRLAKDSFVDENLQQHFSDLLYRVRLRADQQEVFVYLLFEHKSAPDEWVAFQLLRYVVRIWEQSLNEGSRKLPLVFPLVLSHGRTRWKGNRKLSALLDWERVETAHPAAAARLRPHQPEFEYYLCDLSAYSDAEIKGAVFLQTTLLLLKNIHRPDLGEKLLEIFSRLALLPEQRVLEYLRTLLIYVAAATDRLKEPEVKQALRRVFVKNEGGRMASFLDVWIQEGVEKGLQQGLQQGRFEGISELTLRLLEKRVGKVTQTQRKAIGRLSLPQLEQLGEDLLDFESADDLKKWLQKHSAR